MYSTFILPSWNQQYLVFGQKNKQNNEGEVEETGLEYLHHSYKFAVLTSSG